VFHSTVGILSIASEYICHVNVRFSMSDSLILCEVLTIFHRLEFGLCIDIIMHRHQFKKIISDYYSTQDSSTKSRAPYLPLASRILRAMTPIQEREEGLNEYSHRLENCSTGTWG
jgi:hypothetical protein